jgi:uncharacterized protein (TIGR03435 family)
MSGRFGPDSRSRFQNYSIGELSQAVGRLLMLIEGSYSKKIRVSNQTGLRGQFNFKLRFDFIPHITGATRPEFGGKTIFEALERDLGLKLEKIREPLDVTVVDRVDRTLVEN